MSHDEKTRVDSHSEWYLKEQLLVDKKLIEYRYKSIEPYFKGADVLELGPAEGHMTKFLLEYFKSVTVVEGAKELLEQIPGHPNLTKINSLFENFKPQNKFSTCVLDHVLEHVMNPVDILKRCKEWVKADGHLIVGVPNGNSFHRLLGVKMGYLKDSCELNSRDHDVGHRRVYTLESLRRDIESADLQVQHTGGSFFKLLSNSQMEKSWSEELFDGCFALGQDFKENASDIFAVCSVKS